MQDCFHCGSPLRAGEARRAGLLGAERAFCCEGCEAVARTIVEGGFGRYYETRTAPAGKPVAPARAAAGGAFAGDEAALVLEGVRCSACLWLIERVLLRAPGVRGASVNYATRRARVSWDAAVTDLDAIVRAVHAVGYRARPYHPALAAEARRRESRAALWRLFVAAFGSMQAMMYAFPAYVDGADGTLAGESAQLMRWAGLLLTAPVLVFSCQPFFAGAWRELRSARIGLETPIALGLAGAFAASAWATVSGGGEVYFDSVSMLAFLLLGARFLESAARERAGRVLDPLLAHAGTPALAAGEQVAVAPGERIPTDGVVVEGASAADESLLTGESRPVPKRPGDPLVAGAVNLDQPLLMRATRVGADTRAAAIARLAERAAGSRPGLVAAADAAARPLTLLVLAVAAATLWLRGDPWAALAVVVVTCPCALALASPLVLVRANALLLGRGVLVTRSAVYGALEKVTDVLVDKTGTLTEGRMKLARVILLGEAGEQECLRTAGALESASRHPIARAFPHAGDEAKSARYFAGSGVEAEIGGETCRMGTEAFCRELCGTPASHAGGPATLVFLGSRRGWLAAFELADAVRPEAAALVAALKGRGIRVHLLSGDSPQAAAAVARATGIERSTGAMKPEDKLAYVRALQREGRVVAMIGDGLNDGPVLAAADASIALGSGADATQLRADVVLLSNALSEVTPLLDTARGAMRLVRQSIAWALAYNAAALPLAAAGIIGPLQAALGMGASSLAVLLNASRPLARKEGPWKASRSSFPSPSPSYS